MDYILSQHLVNSCGNTPKTAGRSGRSGRVIITKEALVLRELRIQSGLSMRKAGLIVGCSDSYISHIENGRCDFPRGPRLNTFLEAYGGIKQKSFLEKVRRYTTKPDYRSELMLTLSKLPEEKVKTLLEIARHL